MGDDPGYGRRRFLRDSAASFVKTAQEYVKHRDAPTAHSGPPPRIDWLRPPGAVAESLFLERCTRCGDCAKVCPHGSITFDLGNGSPVIFPDETPCYLCEDFPCVAACATKALLPLNSRKEVKMGLASVSHRNCTAEQGCNACVSQCPTEALSMDFSALRVLVSAQRCVGCGLCEYACKSVNDAVAIKVRPIRHVAEGPVTIRNPSR